MKISPASGYPPYDAPKPVCDDVWVVDAEPMHRFGLTLPVRMTVIRLGSGALWLHSPTRFSGALLARLETLGPVQHLVAPNIGHWTFLSGWQGARPEAETWAAPNLRRRSQVRASAVRLDHDLSDEAPRAWAGELEQTVIQGAFGFREVAFLHRASRTLLLADLLMNLERATVSSATVAYARATGTLAPDGSTPAYLRLPLRMRRKAAAQALQRVLGWNPERVIFSHGRWFERDGSAELRRAWHWLSG